MKKEKENIIEYFASVIRNETDVRNLLPNMSKSNTLGVVRYGSNNKFPQEILSMNANSSINQSIIDTKVTYVVGKGIKENTENGNPNNSYGWSELFERCTVDFITFGGFYIQIIKNKNDKTFSFFHQPFEQVRISDTDQYGGAIKYKIHKDWRGNRFGDDILELDAWGGVDDSVKGSAYVLGFSNYRAGVAYYPIPDYFSAANYIQADGLMGSFHRNSISNGFNPNVVITYPFVPTDEQKEETDAAVKRAYTGANGINSVVSLYGVNKDKVPIISPFKAENNTEMYDSLSNIIFQKLISAHRLTSPVIAGLSGGSNNLGSNAGEIAMAVTIFNATVVEKLRSTVLNGLNSLLSFNDIKSYLEVDELDIISDIKSIKTDEK